MMDSCSKMTAGLWKEARKATCRLRILIASSTNRSGKPSANFLLAGGSAAAAGGARARG